MKEVDFDTMQTSFAQRLVRLIQVPSEYKSGEFEIDQMANVIEEMIDGTEDTSSLIVNHIPKEDRRLREVMVSINHPLADCPSPQLFGDTFSSDDQRLARYELLCVLMVQSRFPVDLLDDGVRFERWQFAPTSEFFKSRKVKQLNEQFCSCWARRLLSYFGSIANVKVPGRELRDNLARGNSGATTESLMRQEMGTPKPTASPALSSLFSKLKKKET
jgi:hypothetical protein